jgi:hypothetical protein
MSDHSDQPERPRAEPEIIPPSRGRYPSGSPYIFTQGGTHRIYIRRVGPVGIALVMLFAALIVAAIFITVIGAVLVWIPIVALAVIIAAFYRLFRR